ncbi:MAG TPA: shikimate dehydrogenase [Candidatus Margulisiibacteriota bacterium]|nr:shikimate dehydrogenase [Candidatus Margulisiibacteriota bacterium]
MPTKAIYGVLGYPVKHSLSPLMHQAALDHFHINAEYKFFEKTPEELDDFMAKLRENNIRGFNVTIPYKERIMQYIDDYKQRDAKYPDYRNVVQGIGAVNTVIVKDDGKLEGRNTDYDGFYKHLLALRIKPGNVAVIGAGGASRAICFALALKAPSKKKVRVYDIDSNKSRDLMENLKRFFPEIEFFVAKSIEDLQIEQSELLVNASPVGMKKDDPCLVEGSLLNKNVFVYDLIYNPPETKLLQLAKAKGCRYVNGLELLLYQGASSFKHFTGKEADLEILKIMRKALKEGVEKL